MICYVECGLVLTNGGPDIGALKQQLGTAKQAWDTKLHEFDTAEAQLKEARAKAAGLTAGKRTFHSLSWLGVLTRFHLQRR